MRQRIAFWLLLGAITIVGIELIAVLWMEFSGVLDADALIYFAMGRGILNGLTPYIDLFETKPPGVFLLSSVSILLGGTWFAKFVQIAALIAIPVCVIVPARRMGHQTLGVLFGLLLALFTARFSGGFQVESLGAAIVSAYLALIALRPDGWDRKRMILGGLLLFLAIFLKEPFILVAIAGALILVANPRALLSVFLGPLLVAGITELLALTVSGFLSPYLFYLRYMLEEGTGLHGGPLLLRGFVWLPILQNASRFSIFLPVLLILLAGTAMTVRLRRIPILLFALYLTSLAVGAGGDYFAHHFVFAVPFYIALFLLFLKHHSSAAFRMKTWIFGGGMTLIIGVALFHARDNPFRTVRDWRAWDATLHSTAASIDTVLDRCRIDRYLTLVNKGGGPAGFTRHSPLGPVFVNHSRLLARDGSPFEEPFEETLLQAQVVIVTDEEGSGMTPDGWRFVAITFTDTPPPCAAGITLPMPYRMLFRREGI